LKYEVWTTVCYLPAVAVGVFGGSVILPVEPCCAISKPQTGEIRRSRRSVRIRFALNPETQHLESNTKTSIKGFRLQVSAVSLTSTLGRAEYLRKTVLSFVSSRT
jgi:hypothetical protein